jgi:hypothetical protein
MIGRVIAQVAGHRFITVEARIQSQSFRYGIYGEGVLKVGERFLQIHMFPLVGYGSTNFPFSQPLFGAGIVGWFAVEVPRNSSHTTAKKEKKKCCNQFWSMIPLNLMI